MDGHGGSVAGVPQQVADLILGPEHDRAARHEVGDRLAVVDLFERHERACHRHEHRPAVGVRMLAIARTDRPDEDTGLDIALDGDGDLDLALKVFRRELEVPRQAARVETAAVEQARERVGGQGCAIGPVGGRELPGEDAQGAAMVGRRFDRALRAP